MSFFVYYGHDPNCFETLSRYETVVIEAGGFEPPFIENLRSRVPRLLGYLSLSQYPAWKGEPPSEYSALERDNDWGSYWVNPANQAWRRDCLARARELVAAGLGLFLDNLDVREEWGQAMVHLVAEISRVKGGRYLLGNRGFNLLRQLTPYLDGVLFENPCAGNFSQTDRAWVMERAFELESSSLDAFALDYGDLYSPEASKDFQRRFPHWSYQVAQDQSLQTYSALSGSMGKSGKSST